MLYTLYKLYKKLSRNIKDFLWITLVNCYQAAIIAIAIYLVQHYG